MWALGCRGRDRAHLLSWPQLAGKGLVGRPGRKERSINGLDQGWKIPTKLQDRVSRLQGSGLGWD